MVLSNITREELGIHLWIVGKALNALGDPKGSIYQFFSPCNWDRPTETAEKHRNPFTKTVEKHPKALPKGTVKIIERYDYL